jgi:hypothetical protein
VLKQASEFDCVATRDGDHDAIAQIYEAAARRRDADVRLTASDLKILAKLQAASDAAWCMIGLLDTTTDDEMLDSRIEVGANRLQREGGGDARFAIILARISRLRARAATALDRLNRQKGLEPHRSLRFLVWWLCELWREETGQPVTSSASQGGDYIGIPRSPAGRFVLAAVEALQPSSEWFEQHAPFATRVSAVPLTKGGFMLARVVHNLLAEYVACQSGSADSVRPGHPKKAAHTF